MLLVFFGTSTEDITSNNIIIENNTQNNELGNNIINTSNSGKENNALIDWKLRIANSNNILPDDFSVELADIDEIRQFDARAIDELNSMVNEMRKAGISNIWVQSAYRSVAKQKELYNNSISKYIKQRKIKRKSRRINFTIY